MGPDNEIERIPDEPHARAIRWHDVLVKRVSRRRVRVTRPDVGYVDVMLGPGSTVVDAVNTAAALVASGTLVWMPVRRPSGPSGTRRAARSPGSGLRRVEAYLSSEATAAHDRLKAQLGSTKAALEWALTMAPAPR